MQSNLVNVLHIFLIAKLLEILLSIKLVENISLDIQNIQNPNQIY